MQPYSPEIEQAMKKYYATLSEKDRRRYVALAALKLGHGGQNYIAKLLGCSEKTVSRGLIELAGLPEQPQYEMALRKPGGGRPRYDEIYPEIDAQFLGVLKEHTAGNPMDEKVIWTDLTPDEIAGLLDERHHVRVSNDSRHYIFKEDLQKLVDELGIEIRIAHYPPYCSKYNPIEHRLFPYVTRACQGVVFASVALVKELMGKPKPVKV